MEESQEPLWCLVQNHLPIVDHSYSIFSRLQKKKVISFIHILVPRKHEQTSLGPDPKKLSLKFHNLGEISTQLLPDLFFTWELTSGHSDPVNCFSHLTSAHEDHKCCPAETPSYFECNILYLPNAPVPPPNSGNATVGPIHLEEGIKGRF